MRSFYQSKKNKLGFTLTELIVAIGLFSTVVAMSLGSLVDMFRANNRARSISSVMSNLNNTVEEMTRTIRFTSTYHCGDQGGTLTNPRSCTNGDTFLAVSTSSSPIKYIFQNGKIQTTVGNGSFTNLTSDEVTIQHLKFYVANTTAGDDRQPYVLLVIKGYAGTKPSEQSSFDIETIVSQRELDL